MDRNFNDMYQEDAVAACNTTTLESLSGNDEVTSSEQLESDILLSIKQEEMVGLYNVCVCVCVSSATVCGIYMTYSGV
jgi:hypothetical protein